MIDCFIWQSKKDRGGKTKHFIFTFTKECKVMKKMRGWS